VRQAPPVVVRGDPAITARLIRESPHRWKYTSGVLSFAELISPAAEETIIDRFERAAFAGLAPADVNCLWVRHTDHRRTELHIIIPRIHLTTGKSFNPAPPGPQSRGLFDTLRRTINYEFGFSDPDDRSRQRSVSIPNFLAKLNKQAGHRPADRGATVREAVTRLLEQHSRQGFVKSRADVVAILRKAGFAVPRESKHFITIEEPRTKERFRLRGAWYEASLTPGTIPRISQPAPPRPDPARARALAPELERLMEIRAKYNRERYKLSVSPHLQPQLSHDRTGTAPSRIAPASRSSLPATRPRVCEHAGAVERAAQFLRSATLGFQRACERFGRSARTLTESFAQALGRLVERDRTQTLLRKYGILPTAQPRHNHEMELEMEMEL
jgi:hypothetical protein